MKINKNIFKIARASLMVFIFSAPMTTAMEDFGEKEPVATSLRDSKSYFAQFQEFQESAKRMRQEVDRRLKNLSLQAEQMTNAVLKKLKEGKNLSPQEKRHLLRVKENLAAEIKEIGQKHEVMKQKKYEDRSREENSTLIAMGFKLGALKKELEQIQNLEKEAAEKVKLEKAMQPYKRDADKGDSGAQYILGLILQKEGKTKEANEYFEKAKKGGNTHAKLVLHKLFYNKYNMKVQKYIWLEDDVQNYLQELVYLWEKNIEPTQAVIELVYISFFGWHLTEYPLVNIEHWKNMVKEAVSLQNSNINDIIDDWNYFNYTNAFKLIENNYRTYFAGLKKTLQKVANQKNADYQAIAQFCFAAILLLEWAEEGETDQAKVKQAVEYLKKAKKNGFEPAQFALDEIQKYDSF